MLISTGIEQISVLPKNVEFLQCSPIGSNSDSNDGLPQASELPDSPNPSTVFTDVNVVPEHENQELEKTISSLEGEIWELRLEKRSLDEKRREALNRILDIKGSIRVFCRVRPFRPSDRRRIQPPISIDSEQIVVRSAGGRKEFGFDKVFSQDSTQENVFLEVEPILKSALDGHNVCVLAYGQTGTGKTYTMDGTNDQPGIVPRALELLFREACPENSSSVALSMSMLEVYMGTLRDLLAPKPACRAYEAVARCNLNVQTDPKGSVEIEGLTEVHIPDLSKAKWWYTKGRRVRSTSWTNVNEASSRSHCLTRISIIQHGEDPEAEARISKLWLVDLGGSERLLKTGATGLTLDEGRSINLSLSALGDVIASLRRKRGHVPFRNSKLTQILKDCLGDGSKVLMLVHVSPSAEDVNETICSLSFAKRARAVECNKELNKDLKRQREKMIEKLEEEMRDAEEECQKVRNQIKKAELLLHENIKHYTDTNQAVKNEEKALPSPKDDPKEIVGTPRTPVRSLKAKGFHSQPRFMTSTVASRQRQTAAERQLGTIARSSRSMTRSSIRNTGSLSSSHCDARLKAILKSSNKKLQSGATNIVPSGSPRCNGSDTKTASLPRSKMVTSSDPNVRVMLCRHRRRMSNLI